VLCYWGSSEDQCPILLVWLLRPDRDGDKRPLIRSHRQPPARTCNLSMDGPDPLVHIQGCPWSSAVVGVRSDVHREALRQTLVIVVVLSGYLDVFCDHKVFERSSAQRDHRRSNTLGVVWHPVALAQPDHTPARGQPSTQPTRAPPSSAPGLVALEEVDGMPHPAHPALPQQFSGLAIPESCPPGEGMVWWDLLR
jgi:hypothetical protein